MESLRLKRVQMPVIPIIGQWIKENPGTISLGQGVVNYGPPEEAFSYVKEQFGAGVVNKYALGEGIEPLLEIAKKKLYAENDIVFNAVRSSIFVTAGANMAFYNLIFAIADPDDEIILLTPYYFNYEMAISIAGCKAVCVSTDSNYQPDLAAIRKAITSKTRAVVTISPNNPTGVVYSHKILTEINLLCRECGIYHICDEAYEYFVYGEEKHFSPGSIKNSEDYTISVYSLSKAYGMAGWRIGFIILPKHLEMAFKKIQDTNVICASVASQYMAVAAMKLGPEYSVSYRKKLKEVQKMVFSQLKKLGNKITFSHSDGAFYVFMRINNTKLSSMELVKKLIFEYGVAVVPGDTFGVYNGCYIRLAYGALEEKTVSEGIGRFIDGISQL